MEWLLQELGTGWDQVVVIAVTAVAIYLAALVHIRIAGPRSMSKMSSFDFVITVAVGAVVGSVALTTGSLAQGIVALAVLFVLQAAIAALRRHTKLASVVDNEPILLMDGAEVLSGNLDRVRLTQAELHAKLREANVLNYDQIKVVVLETTGDVSVLHGDAPLDPDLLYGVRDAERVEPER